MQIDWKMTAAAGLVVLKVVQFALGLVLLNWPNAAAWVKVLKTALDDILPNPTLPQVRAMMKRVPPPNVPAVAKVAIMFAVLLSGAARAQVLSHGPTIPLTEVRFADPLVPGSGPQVEAIAPGAGYEINIGFNQMALGGLQWDMLDLELLGFADFGTNHPFQAGSVAIGIGTLNSLVSVVVGTDLVAVANGSQLSGLLTGKETLGNVFVGLNLSINLGPQPTAPPVDTAQGAAALPRGNTIGLPWRGF